MLESKTGNWSSIPMNAPIPNCAQLVSIESPSEPAKFKLHRSSEGTLSAPPKSKAHGADGADQNHLASHIQLPSPKDCFGCVDWFQF
jgi:hypothetical protein